MTMKPTARKFAITAHVASSVGWLGAVTAFLALAVAGLTNRDAQMARAAYLAMELITWYVIVPLAFASLLTGLVVSLGASWGLFRHYWVLAKLLITIAATVLLLVHTQPIGLLAALARETALSGANVGRLQIQIVGDAVVALLALLANVALSVFKPWGVTPYGLRMRQERRTVLLADVPSRLETNVEAPMGASTKTPRWVYVVGAHVIGLALLFLVAHLTGGAAWSH
jgi:hypothetical protein